MINPQWFELPLSRTNFYGPKDVRAIEVRLFTANKEDDYNASIVTRKHVTCKQNRKQSGQPAI